MLNIEWDLPQTDIKPYEDTKFIERFSSPLLVNENVVASYKGIQMCLKVIDPESGVVEVIHPLKNPNNYPEGLASGDQARLDQKFVLGRWLD